MTETIEPAIPAAVERNSSDIMMVPADPAIEPELTLECGHCEQLMKFPSITNCCPKPYCESCIYEKVRATGQCPTCKLPITLESVERNKQLRNLIHSVNGKVFFEEVEEEISRAPHKMTRGYRGELFSRASQLLIDSFPIMLTVNYFDPYYQPEFLGKVKAMREKLTNSPSTSKQSGALLQEITESDAEWELSGEPSAKKKRLIGTWRRQYKLPACTKMGQLQTFLSGKFMLREEFVIVFYQGYKELDDETTLRDVVLGLDYPRVKDITIPFTMMLKKDKQAEREAEEAAAAAAAAAAVSDKVKKEEEKEPEGPVPPQEEEEDGKGQEQETEEGEIVEEEEEEKLAEPELKQEEEIEEECMPCLAREDPLDLEIVEEIAKKCAIPPTDGANPAAHANGAPTPSATNTQNEPSTSNGSPPTATNGHRPPSSIGVNGHQLLPTNHLIHPHQMPMHISQFPLAIQHQIRQQHLAAAQMAHKARRKRSSDGGANGVHSGVNNVHGGVNGATNGVSPQPAPPRHSPQAGGPNGAANGSQFMVPTPGGQMLQMANMPNVMVSQNGTNMKVPADPILMQQLFMAAATRGMSVNQFMISAGLTTPPGQQLPTPRQQQMIQKEMMMRQQAMKMASDAKKAKNVLAKALQTQPKMEASPTLEPTTPKNIPGEKVMVLGQPEGDTLKKSEIAAIVTTRPLPVRSVTESPPTSALRIATPPVTPVAPVVEKVHEVSRPESTPIGEEEQMDVLTLSKSQSKPLGKALAESLKKSHAAVTAAATPTTSKVTTVAQQSD